MSGKCNCEPTFPLSMLNDFARESWVLGVQAAREEVAATGGRLWISKPEALAAIDALIKEA